MPDKRPIPLFPLHAVLFPGGNLPLRIFEPRYLDMISECMKQDTCFGISLILSGKEVGTPATTYEIGTLARIVDWQLCEDGLLGISVRGERRFRICTRHVERNQLVVAEIEPLVNEKSLEMPRQCLPLVEFLRETLDHLGYPYNQPPLNYEDAAWVGYRLAEVLPIDLAQKQYLLQLDDPIQRLERIMDVVKGLTGE